MGLQLVFDLDNSKTVESSVTYQVTKDGDLWQSYDVKIDEVWTRERIRKDLIGWQDTWKSSTFEVQRILTVKATQVIL